ncbi:MAG: M48 family metalloprotease [Acidobacteriota bacterium]|nr:M48 family metalloprotease [Acidobacteriota bacterium]
MSAARRAALVLVVLFGLLAGAAYGQNIRAIAGKIAKTAKTGKDVIKTAQTLRSTFGDISEEEEYYIGRSVAALILSRYAVLNNPTLNSYVNTLGQAVALSSDRPETYAGYHFQVLDTDEVNALAAPGGMIFLTKGLIKRCPDEEALADILAHEIGHVAARHGLQSIKKSRLADAFKQIESAAIQKYTPGELAKLTEVFDGVLGDISESLIEKGYDRKYEYEADESAVKTAAKTGYDPAGLNRFLQTMIGDKSAGSDKGWFKTHPTPEQRIERADKTMASLGALPKMQAVRTARFQAAAAGLK